MDLTEEKVSFDQMPTVVSELKQEISGLKTLVRTLIDAAGAALAIPNESDPHFPIESDPLRNQLESIWMKRK